MHDPFEITSFLQRVLDSPRDGRVQITGKGVDWCLDIRNGQVLFAAHSLQYLTALETVLPSLGYESALSIYWRLIRSESYRWQHDAPSLEKLSWTNHIVAGLVRYEALSLQQAKATLVKLTEDALESTLGLDAAAVDWHPLPESAWYLDFAGPTIASLNEFLSGRQQAWQSVSDRIVSPHQRPYCENPEELYQSIPQGRLSHEMLTSLARLMQGASIRQLAQAIQQDEATLAELLYPYICQQVIKLWPPLQPLARLPWLPAQPSHAESPVKVVPATPRNHTVVNGTQNQQSRPKSGVLLAEKPGKTELPPSRPNGNGKKPTSPADSSDNSPRPLIVCIDDSQAMLEQIESYLDPNHFDLKTIVDPVASVSKICAMKPDLVLMDISMPSINGNSLCQILKRSYVFKDVPIIMISGNASALTKATAESAGATGFLEKPFSKAQLMQVMETYLEIQV